MPRDQFMDAAQVGTLEGGTDLRGVHFALDRTDAWRCLSCGTVVEVTPYVRPMCGCAAPAWAACERGPILHEDTTPSPTGDGEDRALWLVVNFGGHLGCRMIERGTTRAVYAVPVAVWFPGEPTTPPQDVGDGYARGLGVAWAQRAPRLAAAYGAKLGGGGHG